MNDSARAQSVLFKGIAPKPLTVRFEDERTSSDGGAILLKVADRQMGMIAAMAESFTDQRDGSRVKHDIEKGAKGLHVHFGFQYVTGTFDFDAIVVEFRQIY